jgi:hypothetical protein
MRQGEADKARAEGHVNETLGKARRPPPVANRDDQDNKEMTPKIHLLNGTWREDGKTNVHLEGCEKWMRRLPGRRPISGSPGDSVVIDFKARTQPTKCLTVELIR